MKTKLEYYKVDKLSPLRQKMFDKIYNTLSPDRVLVVSKDSKGYAKFWTRKTHFGGK